MRCDRRLLPVEFPVQALPGRRHAAVDGSAWLGARDMFRSRMLSIDKRSLLDAGDHDMAVVPAMVSRRSKDRLQLSRLVPPAQCLRAHAEHSRHGTDSQASCDESYAHAVQCHERLKTRRIERESSRDVQVWLDFERVVTTVVVGHHE